VNSVQSESRRRLSRTSSDQSPTGKSKSPAIVPVREPLRRGTVEEAEGEDDGFPDIVFGRGKMSDQSYVKGPTKAKVPLTDMDRDSDLDSLDPRPKRTSKNIKTMLGESPRGSISTTPHFTEKPAPNGEGVYPNGYSFPPKHTWGEATVIGLKAFGKFTITPLGFFIVLYGLNVVAWGGMLFLLLCNASAPMCYNAYFYEGKDCNHINSPRRIWVEIDSQILNALFCVTGFGLIPWRFRDLYYLLKFRIMKQHDALRRLAGVHKSWFRLPGSDLLPVPASSSSLTRVTSAVEDERNPTVPLPLRHVPSPPLTGVRAPPTSLWKMDYVVWLFVLNTFLQAVLSGFMWGLNRIDRPSWSTGLFVGLACVVAAMAGIMQFTEGKKIKAVEGVPMEVAEVVGDVEAGVEKKKWRKNTEKMVPTNE